MKIKFTKYICQQEALKYKTRGEFYKLSKNIYSVALYNKWLDEICGHMELLRKPREYWNKKMCSEEALKYNNIDKFRKMSRTCFSVVEENKWLDEICGHMEFRTYWNKEKCQEEALKYKTRGEFSKYSGSAYGKALKEKWIDEICKHMKVIKYPKGYWTKEKCQEEALKYKTRSDFNKGSLSAYCKAWDCKWLDEVCSHMNIIGNHYNRCIYSYEFNDNHVYVGLTYNIEERKKQHDKRGPVKKHILNTGSLPIFKILTDYMSNEIAVIKEREFLEYYISNNWKVLNSVKTGALGGGKTKWTKERCQEEALKYNDISSYREGSLSYRAAVRSKWLDEICVHMDRSKNVFNYWTKDKCIECSLLCKSRIEFSKKFPGGYAASKKNSWLDEICIHMKYVEKKPKGYWTKENCQIMAVKYNSRSEFQRESRSVYQISSRSGWLDEICTHMIKKDIYATS